MSGMLASVNSLTEASLVQQVGVSIIDLKQPEQGALGALSISEVTEIVNHLPKAVTLSATVGDLPMQADLVYAAVAAMATTGVDYIKIGFFPGGEPLACIDALSTLTKQGLALIAVLFADQQPDVGLIPLLAKAGFKGVMLDTMHKQAGSLTKHLTLSQLQSFVTTAKQAELLTGLAGSLTVTDIADLLPLNADYLGFRGALCQQGQREACLDLEQVKLIKNLLKECEAGIIMPHRYQPI